MTRTSKILLGVGGGVAVLVVIVIVIIVVVMGYFITGRIQSKDEGREFAKAGDQTSCMTEGLRRSKSIHLTDVGPGISLSAFVEACLTAAKPTPDFCSGVPGMSFSEKDAWITSQCRLAGLDKETSGCFFVFAGKHNVCNGVK